MVEDKSTETEHDSTFFEIIAFLFIVLVHFAFYVTVDAIESWAKGLN